VGYASDRDLLALNYPREKKIEFWLPAELKEWFLAECHAEGLDPNDVFHDFLSNYRKHIVCMEYIKKHGMTAVRID
jgi:hypothetical protein